MGPDLQIQNYLDIGKINVAERNLSRNEASPSPFRGGGAREWVPIKGARIFAHQINQPQAVWNCGNAANGINTKCCMESSQKHTPR